MAKEKIFVITALVLLLSCITPAWCADESTMMFESTAYDGCMRIGNFEEYFSYFEIWNTSECAHILNTTTTTVTGHRNDADNYNYIWRTVLFFDTGAIPHDAVILSVELYIYITTAYTDRPFDLVVQHGTDPVPHEPLVVGDWGQWYYGGNGGALASTSFAINDWNMLQVTTLDWINPYGTTHLVLRTDLEINADEPPNGNEENVHFATSESDTKPYIRVKYSVDLGAGGTEPPAPWYRVRWDNIKELLQLKVRAPLWALVEGHVTVEGLALLFLIATWLILLTRYTYRLLFKRKERTLVKVKRGW